MNPKTKKILGIAGFVVLFITVIYLKTEKKMNRYSNQKTNTEFTNKQIEFQKKQKEKAYQLELQKEQRQRDSIAKLKRDSLETQLRKTRSIIKNLEKEIKEKK